MKNKNQLREFIKKESEGLSVEWFVEGDLKEEFTIDFSFSKWKIFAGSEEAVLWALRHIKNSGKTGCFRPRFSIRGLNICESLSRHSSEEVLRLLDRMVDWRMNRLIVHPQYGWKEHGDLLTRGCEQRGIEVTHYIYTTLAFTPSIDSSLFAKDEHGLPRTHRVECETRLCPSQPDALHQFREGAKKYFSESVPEETRVVLMTADGNFICRCPGCRNQNAIEQWQPFLEIAVEEAHRANKKIKPEFLAYIWRFVPPKDMQVFKNIDSVLFDLHLRYRFAPLGAAHPPHVTSALEAPADARASKMPINQYLSDRIDDWLQTYSGPLYVFENLMLQGSMSCPQTNTRALTADLDEFEKRGVRGVIYEAFEPGIASFSSQIGFLSRQMWSDRQTLAQNHPLLWLPDPREPLGIRLPILFQYPDQLEACCEGEKDSLFREYLRLLEPAVKNPNWLSLCRIVEFLEKHPGRFDELYIYFLLTKLTREAQPHDFIHPLAKEFVSFRKVWDFMEHQKSMPRESVRKAIRAVVEEVHAHVI